MSQNEPNYLNQCNKRIDWNDYLHTAVLEVSLDFSQHSLINIPDDFLSKCSNLQYFYLEGNALTELSKAFFPSLKQLKWLDVRNNELTTIPDSIAGHPCLQVLLLEGNKIERLPVEIGSLSSLRGIQLARNPIIYPPENVINQGVQNTINFLQKQWHQLQSPQHIQLISELHSQTKALSPKSKPSMTNKKQKAGGCKSAVVLKVHSHEPRKPRKVQSGLCAVNLSKCISVQPISQRKPKASIKDVVNNWTMDDDTEEIFKPINYYERKIYGNDQGRNTLRFHNKTNRKKAEEVQPKLLRDIWIEKIRQILMTQEAILQRRKSAEALKQWQDETKMLQQTLSKSDSDAVIKFPYDTDPEYLRMLTRTDLSRDRDKSRRDSSLHNIRHEEPINCTIMSIMAALQDLQISQTAISVSPRSEQKVLAQEIKKIKELQRSLNALKLKNFGQLGLSS